MLCRDLEISRSAYYQWMAQASARRERARATELLLAQITVIWVGSRHTYGVPRIHAELRRRGQIVNRKKIEQLMREHGIVGCHRRRGRRSLTKQEKAARFAPDLLGRDFSAELPGQRLVGDVTYVPTDGGWLYLAGWIDLATKELIGWSTGTRHDAALVTSALEMAHQRGGLRPGCIIHSDRGGEPGFKGSLQHRLL